MEKKRLGFWEIWNMSFGFFGIQFGWGLQMANMSAIYEYLGASADEIPLLWLAAPLTGFIVQPIIGYMSDRTWTRLGRRKPYFLVGAILASLALIAMPNSSALWMAAGLLWILDASINISMEPFRAFVSDMLPKEQHTRGFAMQSFFIGFGAVIASALPWTFTVFIELDPCSSGVIPASVEWSFYIGAAAFMGAVLYTIMRVKEYPPVPGEPIPKRSIADGFKEIFSRIGTMPYIMKRLAVVQFFTWSSLFLMWFYFGVGTTRSVFHYDDSLEKYEAYYSTYRKAKDCLKNEYVDFEFISQQTKLKEEKEKDRIPAQAFFTEFNTTENFELRLAPNVKAREEGTVWGGLCFAFYSLITFVFALFLPLIASRIGKRNAHMLCLLVGGLGLVSVQFVSNQYMLLLPMAAVGIAWTSILSMPYAMFASHLPKNSVGLYMGIFNFFIVIPEIIAALAFGWIMKNILGNDRLAAVTIGGILLLVAATLCLTIKNQKANSSNYLQDET